MAEWQEADRAVWLERLSNDLNRIRSVDNGTLARVGVGLATMAAVGFVLFELMTPLLETEVSRLVRVVLAALLVYWSVLSYLVLADSKWKRFRGRRQLPFRFNPHGLAAWFRVDNPRPFYAAITGVTLGLAIYVSFHPESTGERWAMILLGVSLMARLTLHDLVVALEWAKVFRGTRQPEDDTRADLVANWTGLLCPGALIVVMLVFLHLHRPEWASGWVSDAWLVVVGASFLGVAKFTLQHAWEYDSRMQRAIGSLRMLVVHGDLTPQQATEEYHRVYLLGRLGGDAQKMATRRHIEFAKENL